MSNFRYCHQGHANDLNSFYCKICGTRLEIDADGLVGDRYRIVKKLGHGGFGHTYLAEDINRFNETCVLKELAPAEGNSLEKAQELFIREARVLYKLQHPQIPKFRESFVDGKRKSMFLVQEYVEGPTYEAILRDRKQQGRTFSEAEAQALLAQLLPVLDYIHGQGVIHRDISPDNLICRNNDHLPVLLDFGGVKAAATTAVREGTATQDEANRPVTLLGKVGYSPEEQIRRGQVTKGSDLYALGVTLLVLMIGKEPSEFYDGFHLKFDWRSHLQLSPGFGQIIDKLVAYQIGDRYSATAEVQQALSALAHPQVQSNFGEVLSSPQAQPIAPNPPSERVPQSTMGAMQTVVVAPAGTNFAGTNIAKHDPGTMVAGNRVTQMAATQPNTPQPKLLKVLLSILLFFPKLLGSAIYKLLQQLLILGLLVGSGFLGWGAVRWWLEGQFNPSGQPENSPQLSTTAPTSSSFSDTERSRKAALIARLEQSQVNQTVFYRLVNEAYYLKYPGEKGKLLSNRPEDEPLRKNWDGVADQILDTLDGLSSDARDRLGGFSSRDRQQWDRKLQNSRVEPQQFYEELESKLKSDLPMYRRASIESQYAMQILYGMAFDRVQRL
jgi:serine/threonine protein kinase, bacterial